MTVVVPIRTMSESNRSRHEHWSTTKKRVDAQHEAVRISLRARSTRCPFPVPMTVTLTRMSPGRLDTGNLGSAMKHVQDAVARWIGIDDRHDHLVEYTYRQEKTKRGAWGVRIEIARRGT
jgi:hypothetical protein